MRPQPLDTQILDARVEFADRPFRTPLLLSSGPIDRLTEATATVRVRVAGREAQGRGSIYLSDLWAWPEPRLSHAQRDALMRRLCLRIGADLAQLCGGEPAHPLQLGLQLHRQVCDHAAAPTSAGDPTPPALALAVCLSPFDAAIHDAAGHALSRCAMLFYGDAAPIPAADALFPGGSACAAINAMIRPRPLASLPAWWVVGGNDDLERDVRPAVERGGYRHFKLKLKGVDNAADLSRTLDVFAAARRWGLAGVRLSLDSNEANPSAASVLDYLEQLQAADAEAFAAVAYLEQPTGRDILAFPQDWRAVARLKPVLLDEGLTSLDLLTHAQEQGWSGLAIKTCKGHSFALTAAAWAHQHGQLLSLQDLTNPGYAAIHAAVLGAWLPTINGVELNSPQFTPQANAAWLPRLSCLLEPRDGVHKLPDASPAGLGSAC